MCFLGEVESFLGLNFSSGLLYMKVYSWARRGGELRVEVGVEKEGKG